jgi:hypothetical protein
MLLDLARQLGVTFVTRHLTIGFGLLIAGIIWRVIVLYEIHQSRPVEIPVPEHKLLILTSARGTCPSFQNPTPFGSGSKTSIL